MNETIKISPCVFWYIGHKHFPMGKPYSIMHEHEICIIQPSLQILSMFGVFLQNKLKSPPYSPLIWINIMMGLAHPLDFEYSPRHNCILSLGETVMFYFVAVIARHKGYFTADWKKATESYLLWTKVNVLSPGTPERVRTKSGNYQHLPMHCHVRWILIGREHPTWSDISQGFLLLILVHNG